MSKQTAITCAQSRAIDSHAIEDLGIPGIVLMENAGRGCVEAIVDRFSAPVTWVAAGVGNNGGDGFVMARILAALGHPVRVALVGDAGKIVGDALVNYQRAVANKVSVIEVTDSIEGLFGAIDGRKPTVFVDALLGTGAKGAPRGILGAVIQRANEGDWVRVAIDVPSGLDADSGGAHYPTLIADVTYTFVRKKIGFETESAKEFIGDVVVVPIGVPDSAVEWVLSEAE